MTQHNQPSAIVAAMEPVLKMSRDLRKSSVTLGHTEARFLVDVYYQMQEGRIADAARVRSIEQTAEKLGVEPEPHAVLDWLYAQHATLEKQVHGALEKYSDAHIVGRWARSIVGVGPVIAAGLLAHIDIARAPTAGHIWNFAGLNPGAKWEQGKKRPWNAALKVLCWKLGESFVKTSGHDASFYGPIYAQRKTLEEERNARGELAEQAAETLKRKRIGKDTIAYSHYIEGRLPPAHIHARAKRWAVKLFLSHYHHVAHVVEHGTEPPVPYAIAHLGHAHYLAPPNWPMA